MSERRIDGFRWLCATLQADPTLAGIVEDWRIRDGQEQADVELIADAVRLRLTPIPEPEEMICSDGTHVTYRTPLLVQFDVVTPSELGEQTPDQQAAVWGAIIGALPQGDVTLRADANKAGVSWWEWVRPAIGDYSIGGGYTLKSALGTLRLVIFQSR